MVGKSLGEHFGSGGPATQCLNAPRQHGVRNSIYARQPAFQFLRSQAVERNTIDQSGYDALVAEFQASLAREDVLRKEKDRGGMLAEEFEHRINNGLQLIASLLSSQSRTMTTPEASIQLASPPVAL